MLPCASKVGCQSFLQSAVQKQLGFVGLLFAGGAGGCLLLMALTHAYIERINFDRQKAASGSAQGMSIYSGQDASREPGAPPGARARACALPPLPPCAQIFTLPFFLPLPPPPPPPPGTKNATRTMLARQSSARGSLPPANVRTGFGAAAAYDDPDPSSAMLDEQPLMGAGRTPTLATQTRRR